MLSKSFVRVLSRADKVFKQRWSELTRDNFTSARVLSDSAFLARFQPEEVVAALAQDNVMAARQALLAHYGRRAASSWPAIPRSITYRSKHVAGLSRAELLAEAGALLAHRFKLSGCPEISLGSSIDWSYNPTSDPQARWTRALNRHQWWPVLARAYAETGDECYAEFFVNNMLDWVRKNPPPPGQDEKNVAWTLMGVGLRCVIWPTVFAQFYTSPAFTAEAKLTMLRSIYDHGRFLFLFKTNRNHLLRESNGLAYLGTYFPEFNEAGQWQQMALHRLNDELAGQVNRDGTQVEMSTGYQWLVIEEFENAYNLLQANNLSLPGENLAAWLEKMYGVLAYLARPDSQFPQLNDGFMPNSDHVMAEIVRAGQTFNRPDLAYIGTAGRQGTRPARASVSFENAGWYVMRSDWTRQAHYLVFEAGPFGGPHGHEDKLSFELCVFGRPFIVDAGSYNRTDPDRLYLVGSQAHNTVLVEGLSQVRRWQEQNLNPVAGLGNFATWFSRPEFDYVTAAYTDGYDLFQLKKPAGAIPLQVGHTRHIIFVKPDYWLIVDELEAETSHNYQVLFHLHPDVRVSSLSTAGAVLESGDGGVRLHLVPAAPQQLQVKLVQGSKDPIQGWYSDTGDQATPAPVIIWDSAATVIATLLYPSSGDIAEGGVTVNALPVTGGAGLAWTVSTPGGVDYLLLAKDNNLKQFGPYRSTGLVAGIRTDGRDRLISRFEA